MTDQQKGNSGLGEPQVFSEFLESVPPGTTLPVGPTERILHPHGGKSVRLRMPEIRLFCSQESCNGYRFFSAAREYMSARLGGDDFDHIVYTCRNCGRGVKIYSLWMRTPDKGVATVMKFGEWPEFGPPRPSRLITLVGPDRELFLKGRRSENQGLGIGAFGYYRRVVENQKDRIFERIIRVSEKLGADQEVLTDLKSARKETQFSKAVEVVRHAIPQALLINGHNPLTLLHSALSSGLHSESDDACLEFATSIRVVLTDLADRMGQALKDEAELAKAVSRLLGVQQKKVDG